MTQLRATAFLLRPLTTADAPAMAAAVRESQATVGKWMSWAHRGYSEADALDWVALCETGRADGSAHEFGIFRSDGQAFVGVAGLNQFNRLNGFCNLGYWVRESAQRQGAGLAAVGALADYAFEQLHQHRVEIVVADGNLPSLTLARKAGAVYECLARKRLQLHGAAVSAHVLSLVPGDRPRLS
ncbi:GNAT family N-acetyltransferase [Massilia sp. TN1-12]|uniref:GNAT family N-acetyltransferase n=1 Tax=Massilia paldalensis TaxID=3377675 RepID=UPI00384F2975